MTYVLSMAKALSLASALWVGADVRCPNQAPGAEPACTVLALAPGPDHTAVVILTPRTEDR